MNPHQHPREFEAANGPKTEVSKLGTYQETTRQPQEWDITEETQGVVYEI